MSDPGNENVMRPLEDDAEDSAIDSIIQIGGIFRTIQVDRLRPINRPAFYTGYRSKLELQSQDIKSSVYTERKRKHDKKDPSHLDKPERKEHLVL